MVLDVMIIEGRWDAYKVKVETGHNRGHREVIKQGPSATKRISAS